MDMSLDDIIQSKEMQKANTGVRSRLGFQRKAAPIRNADIGMKSLRTFQGGISKVYDARQKLSSQLQAGVGNRTLHLNRGANAQLHPANNSAIAITQMQPNKFGNSTLSTLQKTKFVDARQRLEMKRSQQMGSGDARMKLLAKRRFGLSDNSSPAHQPDTAMQVVPAGQKVTVSRSLTSNISQRSMSLTPLALVRNTTPIASSGRQFDGTGFKKIVRSDIESSHALPYGVSISGGQLRRTFNAHSHQQLSDSVVEYDLDDIGKVQSSPYKISFVNDLYEEQRPIETIVSSRTAHPAPVGLANQTKSATAAAKTAVTAAAMASVKPVVRSGAITVTKRFATHQPAVEAAGASSSSGAAASSLQGYRVSVSNLHPSVTLDDLMELFSDVGPLRSVRLERPGMAYIVFVNVQDAIAAQRMYHTRELDGQPMSVNVMFQPPESLPRPKPTIELDIPLLHRALFKTVAEGSRPSLPVNFTVQL